MVIQVTILAGAGLVACGAPSVAPTSKTAPPTAVAPAATVAAPPSAPVSATTTAEARARDATRKADVQRLADALLAYYRERGRFPCSGDNVWVTSSDGPNWIVDRPAECGETAAAAPLTGPLPVDPLNEPGLFWQGAHAYSYRSYRSGCPAETRGKYFAVGAMLESPDPADPGQTPRDCTGEPIPWRPGVWAITVLEP